MDMKAEMILQPVEEDKLYREMVYERRDDAVHPYPLAEGTCLGIDFVVLSLGSHPCCYLRVPEGHPYYQVDYPNIPLSCHGGLTYSAPGLTVFPSEAREGCWIGWDYAHWNDFTFFDPLRPLPGRKWTTEELLADVREAAVELLKLADN